MLTIECNKCHFSNKVQYTPEIAGKRIMFKCKNHDCNEFITIKLPQRLVDEKVTEIIDFTSGKNREGGFLEYEFDNQTLRFPLIEGEQTLGRISKTHTPDIPLENKDHSVSRNHCIIEGLKESGKTLYIIKDNDSTNGTKLNGVALDPEDEIYLEDNDEIELGITKLKFNYF